MPVVLIPYFGMDESNGMAINDNGQIVAAAWNTASSSDWQGFLLDNGIVTSMGNIYPYDLNNSGIAVGSTKTATGNHAAIWDNGTITDLTELTGVGSRALSMNDKREIILIEGGQAYLWSNSSLINLNEVISDITGISAASLQVEANDINYQGQITGLWREDGVYPYNMFVLTPEVVPVPGAVLLGILGLSVAGIKLRKHT